MAKRKVVPLKRARIRTSVNLNDPQERGDRCFLLYFDILGFRETVASRPLDQLEALFEDVVIPTTKTSVRKEVHSLCFSDTVIFWVKENAFEGETQEARAFHAIESLVATADVVVPVFLANQVPVRGIITYGDFRAIDTSSDKHQAFFGQALVNAYLKERDDNWIGVRVDSLATNRTEPAALSTFERLGHLLTREGEGWNILLNPFVLIYNALADVSEMKVGPWRKKWFADDTFVVQLLGFNFINSTARHYASLCKYADKNAKKYFATAQLIQHVFGAENYDWLDGLATEVSNDLKGLGGEVTISTKNSGVARRLRGQ
jgi:hypothetical protein